MPVYFISLHVINSIQQYHQIITIEHGSIYNKDGWKYIQFNALVQRNTTHKRQI